jgi:hypothetical protein
MYNFKCQYVDPEGLNRETGNYVLGALSNDEEKTIKQFNELNYGLKDLIEKCYYIVSSNKDLIKESSYIMTYNGHTVNFFTEFALLINYETSPYYQTFKEAAQVKYREFIVSNLFPHKEDFEDKKFFSYIARKKAYLVFAYSTEEERILFTNLIEEFRFFGLKIKYPILLVNTYQLMSNKFLKFLPFASNSGIYLSDYKFKSAKSINKAESFTIQELVKFLEELFKSSNGVAQQESKVDISTYRSAKIVEKLEKSDNANIANNNSNNDVVASNTNIDSNANSIEKITIDEIQPSEVKNSNRLGVIFVEWLIYSAMFFLVYKRFFANHNQGVKEN